MKKLLLTIIVVAAMLLLTNVGYGQTQQVQQDNSVYIEVAPTDLLNPNGGSPLADKLLDEDMHTSKSIFRLQRSDYTCKELTRFANPGRFLGIGWPEWNNTYTIEVATFAKYKAARSISVWSTPVFETTVTTLGLTKIGEAQATAKNLGKSEHQVMAALAVRCAEAGATTIVFKGFSRPLVTVDSFVVGGGGAQVGSPQSIFNGATGIGSSSSETLTRACVVAELYRCVKVNK